MPTTEGAGGEEDWGAVPEEPKRGPCSWIASLATRHCQRFLSCPGSAAAERTLSGFIETAGPHPPATVDAASHTPEGSTHHLLVDAVAGTRKRAAHRLHQADMSWPTLAALSFADGFMARRRRRGGARLTAGDHTFKA